MFLIDTSVSSESGKPIPDERVLDWLRVTPSPQLFLSAVSVGEHRHGAERLPSSWRRTLLEGWIEQLLIEFRGRILPVGIEIADRWGRLSAANKAVGREIGVADTLIGATAEVHGLTVVTRNVRHFRHLTVAVLNPWEPA